MQTARDRVRERWNKDGKPYYERNKAYYSTFVLYGALVWSNQTAEANVGALRFAKDQKLPWFSYGIDQLVNLGPAARVATLADTNLGEANHTNGATDFVIEGIGIGVRDCRAAYTAEERAKLTTSENEAVIAALSGMAPMVDPAGIWTPPQFGSPFNTEVPFWHGLSGLVTVVLNFDNGRPIFELGCANQFPDASGNSQMRASGMPLAGNAFPLPDGYQWNHEGDKKGQSSMVLQGKLAEDVVIPINLPVNPASDTEAVLPTGFYVSVRATLYGAEFEAPNENG